MKKIHLSLLILLVVVLGLQIIDLVVDTPSRSDRSAADTEILREYATELYNQKLYRQAVPAYQKLLDAGIPAKDKRANIYYIMGNLCMDHLHDYEEAMSHYTMARLIRPDGETAGEMNRRIVECLERLDRGREAQRKLDRLTSPEGDTRKKDYSGGIVVARIDSREVTWAEITDRIDELPERMRETVDTPEAQLDFVRQYIFTELMYETARRKGYDRDPEIIEASHRLTKGLVVQKLLAEEVEGRIGTVRDSDLRLYYQAYADRYGEQSFDEVKNRVRSDLAEERRMEAFGTLQEKMLEAEAVKIYEDRILEEARTDG